MARLRHVPRALVAAIILMLALSSTTLGVVSGNAYASGASKQLCSNGFCMTVNFGSRWTTYLTQDAGKTYRVFDDIEMWGAAAGGNNCTYPACTGWSFGARAWIYNSAGQQLKYISDPPLQTCYGGIYPSTTKSFSRCATSAFQLIGASTIKFTWTMAVTCACGYVTTVSTSKTVSVTGQ